MVAHRFDSARQHVFGGKTVRVEGLEKLRVSHSRSIRGQAAGGYSNIGHVLWRAQLRTLRRNNVVDGLRTEHLHTRRKYFRESGKESRESNQFTLPGSSGERFSLDRQNQLYRRRGGKIGQRVWLAH